MLLNAFPNSFRNIVNHLDFKWYFVHRLINTQNKSDYILQGNDEILVFRWWMNHSLDVLMIEWQINGMVNPLSCWMRQRKRFLTNSTSFKSEYMNRKVWMSRINKRLWLRTKVLDTWSWLHFELWIFEAFHRQLYSVNNRLTTINVIFTWILWF